MKPFLRALALTVYYAVLTLPAAAQDGEVAAKLEATLESCEEALLEAAKTENPALAKTPCNESLADVKAVSASENLSSEERALSEFAFVNLYVAKVALSNREHGTDVPEETCPLLRKATAHADKLSFEDLPDRVRPQAQLFINQARDSVQNCPESLTASETG